MLRINFKLASAYILFLNSDRARQAGHEYMGRLISGLENLELEPSEIGNLHRKIDFVK